MLIDEFAGRYVYFFAGFWLAQHVFGFAAAVERKSSAAIIAGLFIWGIRVWKREQIEKPSFKMAPQVSSKEAY